MPVRSAAERLLGLIGDGLRLPLALVVWNFRKTNYRIRGDWTRCPCHSQSDSGLPLETRCDATLGWNRPARFRAVCPALRMTSHGACCSLPAASVRPYWGRAFAFFAGVLLAVYLAGATLSYGVIRASGNHEIAWFDCAWPARWPRIGETRSRYFSSRAIAALGRHDYLLARLSLQSAIASDPKNYDAASLFAMLESYAPAPSAAHAAFEWLIARFPEQEARSSLLFHDLLLAQGRGEQLAKFSLWMARRDPTNVALWTRAVLEGLRLADCAAAFAQSHTAALRELPPPARALVAAEILLQTDQAGIARTGLQNPVDPTGSTGYVMVQIGQLLRAGDIAHAVTQINLLKAQLGELQAGGLHYLVEQKAGNETLAHLYFEKLITGPVTDEAADWLISILIRAPDGHCLAALDRKLANRPATPTAAHAGGMWVAARLCGDAPIARRWEKILQSSHRIDPASFPVTSLNTPTPGLTGTVADLVTQLPLSREGVYALRSRTKSTNPPGQPRRQP